MDNRAAALAWCSVAVTIGLAGPSAGAVFEQGRPALARITMEVTNLSDVSPAILDRAEVEVGRTFRRMGVKVIWLAAAPGPAGPRAGSDFTIKLIIQPRLAGTSPHGSRSVMAFAPRMQSTREGSIYVFYDRVTDVAAVNRADTALLMGNVISHEMGHLLLHHAAHAAEGLMRGIWDADAIRQGAAGLLWFSPAELHEIRETLSTCCTL